MKRCLVRCQKVTFQVRLRLRCVDYGAESARWIIPRTRSKFIIIFLRHNVSVCIPRRSIHASSWMRTYVLESLSYCRQFYCGFAFFVLSRFLFKCCFAVVARLTLCLQCCVLDAISLWYCTGILVERGPSVSLSLPLHTLSVNSFPMYPLISTQARGDCRFRYFSHRSFSLLLHAQPLFPHVDYMKARVKGTTGTMGIAPTLFLSVSLMTSVQPVAQGNNYRTACWLFRVLNPERNKFIIYDIPEYLSGRNVILH